MVWHGMRKKKEDMSFMVRSGETDKTRHGGGDDGRDALRAGGAALLPGACFGHASSYSGFVRGSNDGC